MAAEPYLPLFQQDISFFFRPSMDATRCYRVAKYGRIKIRRLAIYNHVLRFWRFLMSLSGLNFISFLYLFVKKAPLTLWLEQIMTFNEFNHLYNDWSAKMKRPYLTKICIPIDSFIQRFFVIRSKGICYAINCFWWKLFRCFKCLIICTVLFKWTVSTPFSQIF